MVLVRIVAQSRAVDQSHARQACCSSEIKVANETVSLDGKLHRNYRSDTPTFRTRDARHSQHRRRNRRHQALRN